MRSASAAFLLLSAAGCCSSAEPADDGKVALVVSNRTNFPVTGVIDAGLWSERLTLWPQMTRSIRVPRAVLPKTVTFTVVEGP